MTATVRRRVPGIPGIAGIAGRLRDPVVLLRSPVAFAALGYLAHRIGQDRALLDRAAVAGIGLVLVGVALRRPMAALVGLLTVLPFLQLVQAWLWRNEILGAAQAANLGTVKDVVVALVFLQAWRARAARRSRLEAIELVALGLLGLFALYVVVPVGPELRVRSIAARSDAAFLLVFLSALWLPIRPSARRWVEPAFVTTAAVIGALGIWNRWSPSGWHDWVASTGLVEFRREVLGAATYDAVLRIEFGGGQVVRAGSLFLSANDLGYFLLAAVGVIAGRFARGAAHRLEAAVALVAALAIVYTNSRSALGLLPVVGLVAAAASRRLSRGAGVLVVAGGAVGVLVGVLGVGGQLTSGFDSGNDRTAGHITAVGEGLGRLVARPLGSGLGTSSATANRFGVEDGLTSSENFFLRVGAQIGLLGALLMLGVVVLVARALWRRARDDDRDAAPVASVAALAGVAIGALVLDTLSELATAWWVFLLAGLVLRSHPVAADLTPARSTPLATHGGARRQAARPSGRARSTGTTTARRGADPASPGSTRPTPSRATDR